MVKSTHISFPQDGLALRITAQDALEQGIKPGDPAVVEVTVRAHTVAEWVAEVSDSTFQTGAEEAAAPGPEPVAATAAPVAATAAPVDSGADEGPVTIRWRSAG
jgi:hypothetical protein